MRSTCRFGFPPLGYEGILNLKDHMEAFDPNQDDVAIPSFDPASGPKATPGLSWKKVRCWFFWALVWSRLLAAPQGPCGSCAWKSHGAAATCSADASGCAVVWVVRRADWIRGLHVSKVRLLCLLDVLLWLRRRRRKTRRLSACLAVQATAQCTSFLFPRPLSFAPLRTESGQVQTTGAMCRTRRKRGGGRERERERKRRGAWGVWGWFKSREG